MDFEREIKELQAQASELTAAIKQFEKRHREARIFTARFLAKCAKAEITNVAISRADKSVPSSVNFPFGPEGSIFSFQSEEARKKAGGWSPIWGVVEKMGIGGGCGNHDQHSANTSRLIDGVYELKAGKWQRK